MEKIQQNLVKKHFDQIKKQRERARIQLEKDKLKQEKEQAKFQNKLIEQFISDEKKLINNKLDLIQSINKIKSKYHILQENLYVINLIINSTVDKESLLFSANLKAFQGNGKIYELLSNYHNINITKNIAKIERLKLLGKINNSNLFNIIKDIIFEILKIDLLKKYEI